MFEYLSTDPQPSSPMAVMGTIYDGLWITGFVVVFLWALYHKNCEETAPPDARLSPADEIPSRAEMLVQVMKPIDK